MQNEKEYTKVKAIVTYQSGRQETIHGKLNKGNVSDKGFQKKVAAFRAFPTVVNVEVIKY